MSQHRVPLEILEMIVARHATAPLSHDPRQLTAGQPSIDVHQARSVVGAFTIDAVATGAMLDVRISVTESNWNLVQTNDAADLLGIEDESIAIRVEGRATPFRTAIVCRVEERAGHARGRPRPLIQPLDQVLHEVGRLPAARRDLERLTGKGDAGHRLRRGGLFSGQVAGRRRYFGDVVQRFSGVTVEYEQVTGFRRHRDGIDDHAGAFHLDQGGRGRKVAIPQIVTDGLEVPPQLTGSSVESEQAVGKQIVARTRCSVEVGCGGSPSARREAHALRPGPFPSSCSPRLLVLECRPSRFRIPSRQAGGGC